MRTLRMRAGLAGIAALLAGVSALVAAPAAEADVVSGFPYTTSLADAEARPPIATIAGPTKPTGWFRDGGPTLANLTGGRGQQIVVGSFDGSVSVVNANGAVVWRRLTDAPNIQAGPVAGTPAVGDIDGDGSPDVVAASENGWLFAWNNQGTLKPGWPQFTGNVNDLASTNPKVDCSREVCQGVQDGPTLADIDGDGRAEIIVGTLSHLVIVFEGDGSIRPGWPRNVWDGATSAAAVGDLNGDGIAEIVIGSEVTTDCSNCAPYGVLRAGGLIHAFEPDGNELAGWPFATDSFLHGSPVIADLDGNGQKEVVSGSGYFPGSNARGHYVYAVNANGQSRWGYRLEGIAEGAPAVADVNNDGKAEIAVTDAQCLGGAAACDGGAVYLLGQNGNQVNAIWKRTDSRNQNGGSYFNGPVLADVTGDGQADVVAEDANFGVRGFDINGGRPIYTASTRFSNYGTPAVGDLDGNGTNEIVVGSAAGNGGANDDLAGSGQLWAFTTPGRGGLLFPQFQSRVIPGTYRAPGSPGACTSTASATTTDLPAVRRGALWYLRTGYSSGGADGCVAFGDASDQPVTGDFDGNGTQTLGVFRPSNGTWYLRNQPGGGAPDLSIRFGSPGDVPVVGDWNGDGTDSIGVFRPSTGTWYLSVDNSGRADIVVAFASPGDIPVVGDWNGDGTDTVSVFRPSNATWYVTDANRSGAGVRSAAYGSAGDQPVVGDWNHDGTDNLGVFRGGTWYLRTSFTSGPANGSFSFGSPGDVPQLWSWSQD